jgi:hypothetical protein
MRKVDAGQGVGAEIVCAVCWERIDVSLVV